MASAGHHNNLNGLANFRAIRDGDYLANVDLILHIEHVTGGGVARSTGLRRPLPNGYTPTNFGLKLFPRRIPKIRKSGSAMARRTSSICGVRA